MEAVMIVAVAGLHKYGGIGQALGIHLAGHVVQMHAFTCEERLEISILKDPKDSSHTHTLTYMTACILYGTVAIHIAQLTQTAAIRVIRWIRKAINNHRIVIAMEDLTDSTIELIVGNGCPKRWLRIANLCHIPHLRIEHLIAIIRIIRITIL